MGHTPHSDLTGPSLYFSIYLNALVKDRGVLTGGGSHGFDHGGHHINRRRRSALGRQPLHSHGLFDQKHPEHRRRDRGRCLAVAGIRSAPEHSQR